MPSGPGAAFDDDANPLGAAHGATLVEGQAHPGDLELLQHQGADALGQGLDQLELALADEGDEALGHGLVVEGVVDVIGGRRLADVGGHFQVQAYRLAGAAFPVVDADDGVDAQVAQEDDVHGYSPFRCRATIANSSCQEAMAASGLTPASRTAPIRAMPLHALLILIAYLFGSLSAAIILCRLLGLPDPRTQGSGNPGATNVLRIGGKKAAAATLFLDMLKGLLPVLLARALEAPLEIQAAVAFAAFLGHLYPVFFRFQGGKGVATALGVLLGLNWLVGLATIATWLVMALLFRISSLAALTAILLTPLYVWLLDRQVPLLAVAGAITLLLFWRHRSNIRKLLDGTEGRISLGSRKIPR